MLGKWYGVRTWLLLILVSLTVFLSTQAAYAEEVFVGHLNIGHTHFDDDTTLDTFYLFDYEHFTRPPVILLVDSMDPSEQRKFYDFTGQRVVVKGTIVPDPSITDAIFVKADKILQTNQPNVNATVELDQKVYPWTDKVYITIVAPDYNFDSDLIDEIGTGGKGNLIISTNDFKLNSYKLIETGTDTGIFTGEVILTGFCHDADGAPFVGRKLGLCSPSDDTNPKTEGTGPLDGFLQSSNSDSLILTFEVDDYKFSVFDDGRAIIRGVKDINKARSLYNQYVSG